MNLSGPQSDRDRFFRKGPAGKATPIGDEVSDGESARLRTENEALKDQLRRALVELKAYHLQYPSPFAAQAAADSEHDDEALKLSASHEITSALFAAYDTKILELKEKIKQLTAQNESIKENANVLLAENDELRSLNLQGVRGSVEEGSRPGIRLDPTAPLHSEILADLQEQLEVLRSENNLLIEQRGVLLSELEGHQAALEAKAEELAQQSQQLFAAVSDVQKLSRRAEQAEKDRDAAAAQALSYSDVLGKSEVEHEALLEQMAAVSQRCKEAEGLVQEYKRQLRTISSKGDEETTVSMKRVQDAENRVRELHAALHGKAQELDATQEVLRKLRAEYQTTRQDAEGMLQVMAGLERQLNEYAAREAEVEKRDKASREREAETLTFREQCSARDDQNKREIERLLAERKVLALRRKDEIEAAIEGTRKALGEQIASLEKELDVLSERNAKLIFEAEKAGRDGRSAEELYRRVQRLHEEESKAVHVSLRELGEKLEAASRGREQEAVRRSDALEQLRDARSTAEKLRVTVDELRSQNIQSERNHEVAVAVLKATVRELQREVGDKTRLLARKAKDFDEMKAALGEQIAELERRLQDESAQLQRRSAEAERLARDFESAGFAGDLRTQSAIDQLKEKYNTAVALLDARLRTEADQNKALMAKIRQSESVIADLLDDKAELSRQVDDAAQEARLQDEALAHCKATVADLAAQLAASYQAREEGVHRVARTMEDLALGRGASYSEFKSEEVY